MSDTPNQNDDAGMADTTLDGADLDQLLEDAEGGVEGSTLDAEDS